MFINLNEEDQDIDWIGHTVQVVDAVNDRVHIVTLHSIPFRDWWVPTSAILTSFSAFYYLGRAEESVWVEPGNWVRDTRENDYTIRRIESYSGHVVTFGGMYPGSPDENAGHTTVLTLVTHFIPAETCLVDEMLYGVAGIDRRPPDYDSDVEDLGEQAPQEEQVALPRSSAFERLMIEE